MTSKKKDTNGTGDMGRAINTAGKQGDVKKWLARNKCNQIISQREFRRSEEAKRAAAWERVRKLKK